MREWMDGRMSLGGRGGEGREGMINRSMDGWMAPF